MGVFGAQGYGKTTYGRKFVAEVGNSKECGCVFLFDPDGEFSDDLHLPPCRTPYELDQAIPTGWACFNPHIMFPGEMEKALDYLAHYTFEKSKRLPGRKLFVVDELGLHVPVSKVPKHVKIVVQTGGRVAGISCVFIAQQPNELHNTIRQALTEVVCFQLTDDCALEFPKKFGFDTDAIKQLPPYQYICRNKQGQEVRG